LKATPQCQTPSNGQIEWLRDTTDMS